MERIIEDNLILDDITDEIINTKYTTFYLTFLDKEIKVIKKERFDGGETEEEWIFETNLTLTDEDKETIRGFCESQDVQ